MYQYYPGTRGLDPCRVLLLGVITSGFAGRYYYSTSSECHAHFEKLVLNIWQSFLILRVHSFK